MSCNGGIAADPDTEAHARLQMNGITIKNMNKERRLDNGKRVFRS